MILRNTSRYPTDEVRALIEIAATGHDLRHVAVNVKNCSGAYAGRAYYSVPKIANVAASATRLVVLRIGAPHRFPCSNLVTTTRWVKAGPPPKPEGSDAYKEYWREHRAYSRMAGGVETVTFQRRVVERHPYGGKNSPLIEKHDWREALVALAAHEFEHIRQFQNNFPCSEVDCERAAARRLAIYRERKQG